MKKLKCIWLWLLRHINESIEYMANGAVDQQNYENGYQFGCRLTEISNKEKFMRIESGTDLMNYIDCPQPVSCAGKPKLITSCAGIITDWMCADGYKSVEFIPAEDGAPFPWVVYEVGSCSGCRIPGISFPSLIAKTSKL